MAYHHRNLVFQHTNLELLIVWVQVELLMKDYSMEREKMFHDAWRKGELITTSFHKKRTYRVNKVWSRRKKNWKIAWKFTVRGNKSLDKIQHRLVEYYQTFILFIHPKQESQSYLNDWKLLIKAPGEINETQHMDRQRRVSCNISTGAAILKDVSRLRRREDQQKEGCHGLHQGCDRD